MAATLNPQPSLPSLTTLSELLTAPPPRRSRTSIASLLRLLLEYETVLKWSKHAHAASTATVTARPHTRLGYAVRLTTPHGPRWAPALATTQWLSLPVQHAFRRSGVVTHVLALLAALVDALEDDIRAHCRLLAGEVVQLPDFERAVIPGLDDGALVADPERFFEFRVKVVLCAFATSVAVTKDPEHPVVRMDEYYRKYV